MAEKKHFLNWIAIKCFCFTKLRLISYLQYRYIQLRLISCLNTGTFNSILVSSIQISSHWSYIYYVSRTTLYRNQNITIRTRALGPLTGVCCAPFTTMLTISKDFLPECGPCVKQRKTLISHKDILWKKNQNSEFSSNIFFRKLKVKLR